MTKLSEIESSAEDLESQFDGNNSPRRSLSRVRLIAPLFLIAVVITLGWVVIQNNDTEAVTTSGEVDNEAVEKASQLVMQSVNLIESEQYGDALDLLNEAAKLNPSNPIIFYNIGVAQHFSGDIDAAEASYTKSLSIDNRVSSSYYNRGLIKRDKGLLREAAADLEIAAALSVDNAAAYFNLGQVLISLGETEKANEAIAKAKAIDPNLGN